jgi:simple sugar transport system substrate-binding protein
MITHETPGDTFWDKIKAGAQQAATNEGITLRYSNDPDAPKQAVLIQNAVDSKVDGIATTLVMPDAPAGSVKAATAAHIPVVGFNAGIDDYQRLGALMYFGSDETLAGTAAGKRIAGEGAKHPLCVIQQAAQEIQDGKIEFSIDQQPYVQGFTAVTSLYLYLKNGNDIGGGKVVLTGPSGARP